MTVPSPSGCAAPVDPIANGFRKWYRGRVLGVGLLFAVGAALTVAGCNTAAPAKKDNRIEVSVTTPITDEVVEYQDFTGRLDAINTAEIRSHVTGYLTAVPIKEGDYVHKGDLLFQIDPRPYKAQYDQAVTQIALNDATLTLARATLELRTWPQALPRRQFPASRPGQSRRRRGQGPARLVHRHCGSLPNQSRIHPHHRSIRRPGEPPLRRPWQRHHRGHHDVDDHRDGNACLRLFRRG